MIKSILVSSISSKIKGGIIVRHECREGLSNLATPSDPLNLTPSFHYLTAPLSHTSQFFICLLASTRRSAPISSDHHHHATWRYANADLFSLLTAQPLMATTTMIHAIKKVITPIETVKMNMASKPLASIASIQSRAYDLSVLENL
jgi:hypothetical protein